MCPKFEDTDKNYECYKGRPSKQKVGMPKNVDTLDDCRNHCGKMAQHKSGIGCCEWVIPNKCTWYLSDLRISVSDNDASYAVLCYDGNQSIYSLSENKI